MRLDERRLISMPAPDRPGRQAGSAFVLRGRTGARVSVALVMRELRRNGSSKLMLASGDSGDYVVDALASSNACPIRRVAYPAEQRDDFGLVDEDLDAGSALSIETRGCPVI